MTSQAMKDFTAMMLAQRQQSEGGTATPTVEEIRAGFDQTMSNLPLLPDVELAEVVAGGVPSEWTVPSRGVDRPGALLYLHGGGYFEGSPATHRRLTSALSLEAGIRVLSVDYRLAPEHPFPAAVDDAVSAYRWLIEEHGEESARVVVAGDSAGGGLSAALLVALRDSGQPLPAGAFLISPWTDLALTGESLQTRADVDPMIEAAEIGRVAGFYAPEAERRNPLVSPLYADLAGLPPLLVHVGDHEVLLDDALRLVERARAAGVEVESEVWPEAFHVFHMLVGMIPEADEAVAQAAAWMVKRLTAG